MQDSGLSVCSDDKGWRCSYKEAVNPGDRGCRETSTVSGRLHGLVGGLQSKFSLRVPPLSLWRHSPYRKPDRTEAGSTRAGQQSTRGLDWLAGCMTLAESLTHGGAQHLLFFSVLISYSLFLDASHDAAGKLNTPSPSILVADEKRVV